MATETTDRLYGTLTDLYLGWIDASVATSERFARVARVSIDELLGLQYDIAQAARRLVEETRTTLATDEDETANPTTLLTRAGDLARSNYFLATETGLKAQERMGRVAQTAFGEIQSAGSDMTSRVERNIDSFVRQTNVAG